MSAAQEKVKKLRKELEECLAERTDQIEAMIAAIIAKVHILFLGPPGTAKSMLARLICNAIQGGEYFEWLMSKATVPEEILGPPSMKGLKEDKYRRITTKKLPEATIAYLDEVFKSNSTILNSLLSILNERMFHNGDGIQDCPLVSCVGASNELPQGEELGALYDRFMLRFWTKYIESDDLFVDLINPNGTVGNKLPKTKLTMADLDELHKAMRKIKISDDLLGTIRKIAHELRLSGIVNSDRRWKTAVMVLQAFAFLRGLDEVTSDELETLADMMWDRPEDRKKIQTIVAPYGNPLNLKAIEFLDKAKEVFNQWLPHIGNDPDDKKAFQANGTLKEILKEIDSELDGRPDNKTVRLRETQEQITNMREKVVSSINL